MITLIKYTVFIGPYPGRNRDCICENVCANEKEGGYVCWIVWGKLTSVRAEENQVKPDAGINMKPHIIYMSELQHEEDQ